MSNKQPNPVPLPDVDRLGRPVPGTQVDLATANRMAALGRTPGAPGAGPSASGRALEREVEAARREIGEMRAAARSEAEVILKAAQEQAEAILKAAREQAREVRAQANREAQALVAQAQAVQAAPPAGDANPETETKS